MRARWETEKTDHGTWNIIITEIPYQVQKSKLIEKIAELIINKKLPIVADVRDESAEDIRVVIEPKSRNVEPDMLMEQLYKVKTIYRILELSLFLQGKQLLL